MEQSSDRPEEALMVLAVLYSSPVSGASMNPARGLGSAPISGDLGQAWIYIAGRWPAPCSP